MSERTRIQSDNFLSTAHTIFTKQCWWCTSPTSYNCNVTSTVKVMSVSVQEINTLYRFQKLSSRNIQVEWCSW